MTHDGLIAVLYAELEKHDRRTTQVIYSDPAGPSQWMTAIPATWPQDGVVPWSSVDIMARKGYRWRLILGCADEDSEGLFLTEDQVTRSLADVLLQALWVRCAFRDTAQMLIDVALPDHPVLRRWASQPDKTHDMQTIFADYETPQLDHDLWDRLHLGWIWVPADRTAPVEYVFNFPGE